MKILIIALLCTASAALADEPSKEQCVDAHSRGQDAKAAGQLTLAKKLFLSCAQSACPAIVQNDCARFADDLARMLPSLSFAARDGGGADLPDTTVYLDDALVATRLDDGRAHDVDPGKHVVRFSNGGHEQIVTVVVGAGEQGRAVVATFGATPSHVVRPAESVTTHPRGAKLAIGAGLGLVVAGAALGAWGVLEVPGNCALGTHTCAAAPGDPSLAKAASGARMLDLGLVVGGVGVAALAGGLVWYMTGGRTTHEVTPWATQGGGGVSWSGSL
jgi:hypothetical protein